MKRILLNAVILSALILFVSCTESNCKDKYISNFEAFINEIEVDLLYNDEKESEIEKQYEYYTDEMYNIHKDNLTDKERFAIGQLKARYVKAISAKEFDNAMNAFDKFKDEASGFINELIETDNE